MLQYGVSLTLPFGFVLVLDRAWDGFTQACDALVRLRNSFVDDDLAGIDLLAHPPATIACVLRFSGAEAAHEAAPAISAEAARGGLRLLDIGRLTPLEQEHFFARMLPRFALGEYDVTEVRGALYRLLEGLAVASPASIATDAIAETVMPVRFATSSQVLGAFGRGLSNEGVFIESDVLLPVGEELSISLETDSAQGPCQLSARVRDVLDGEEARRQGRRPGFFAEFLMRGEEGNLFEAFLIAVTRGSPWPERSGRRYERFPIRLSAEYSCEGEARIETTGNLSRGGVFLISKRPPAVDTELTIKLTAPGQTEGIELHGVVTHVIPPKSGRFDSGAGVRFTDPPPLVRTLLARIFGEPAKSSERKAMIVDDDRFFRTIFRSALESNGYSVLEAAGGDDAFSLLLTQLLRLDILIVDLHMPGMGGDELLFRIGEVGRDPDLAVAVLTGTAIDEAEAGRLASLGADLVVHKSEPAEHILQRLARAIAARHRS